MKRLTLAFPFDHMSGKLGIKQDLRYPESDNKAFEAPLDKRSYAKNYKPTMVAAHVTRTGLQYFAIKTKSAFKNTAAARLLCALVGAVAAVYSWILKQASILSQLQAQYDIAVNGGKDAQGNPVGGNYEGTFHKYVSNAVRDALRAKASVIQLVGPTATVTIGNNPFSDATDAIAISKAILVKFWNILCPNGITFTVDGEVGITTDNGDFNDVFSKPRINVLGLAQGTGSASDYVTMNGRYLLNKDGDYCGYQDEITAGIAFTTTDVAPNA